MDDNPFGQLGNSFHLLNKMRLVIQRVTGASVSVNSKLISEIKHGLCVLVGIGTDDTKEDAEYCVRKILNTR